MRLFRGVLNHGLPLGENRRHHYVNRRAHAGYIQVNGRTLQPVLCLQPQYAVNRLRRRTQRLETLDMQINRPRPEIASPRRRHLRVSEPPQQRTHRIIRRAYTFHAVKIHGYIINGGRVYLHRPLVQQLALHAQPRQYVNETVYVFNDGQVIYYAYAARAYRSGYDGRRGVLRPAYVNFALQLVPACQDYLIQYRTSPINL
jgi:hypothetical protein